MDGGDEIRTTGREDAATEAAVLRLLLAVHPIQLTMAELALEVTGADGDFASADAVERAVLQLVAVGLAHRNGEVVLPSRAALRLDELLG